jgi:putative ABC transport system ATP-binding protein
MLSEISIRSFISLWDLDSENKFRFYLNGFDNPDKMLFEFEKNNLNANFVLLEHFDEFIILNFFLAFMERTIKKLEDLLHVLTQLEVVIPKTVISSNNSKLQTKVNLFFRIIIAKLSALQELDNTTFRILNLFETAKITLEPLNLISVNFIELNTIMNNIETDVIKGKDLLIKISDKIVSNQKILREYSEGLEKPEIINDVSDFNSRMKNLADLSVDLFIEAEIMKIWGDFFGQDVPNFNFNTDIFSLKDESKLQASENAIITVDGLFKNYNLGTTTVYALRGINLEIFHGEFVIIYGTSGSGKTTLLNCIASLDSPDRGIVLFKGENIHKMTDEKKSKVRLLEMGFIFQNYALLPHYNAKENVTLPADLAGLSKKLKDRINDLLTGVEINLQAKQFPAQLSGGQMQRVSIARSLTNQPSVIFADEPTGDLDSVTGAKVMDLLEHFHKETGTTVVVITHDESLLRYASRVITLKDGLIVADKQL